VISRSSFRAMSRMKEQCPRIGLAPRRYPKFARIPMQKLHPTDTNIPPRYGEMLAAA
jgi:hypothetical protein